MKVLASQDALNQALNPLRGRQQIALVPTMGNLHEGHLTLTRKARACADTVVASIFVNPLQFGEGEDFDGYPRTLEQDSERLASEGVDFLFVPSVQMMYPKPEGQQTRVQVPVVSDILCGASRPGHFSGVATVVCKLFNQVRPDVAVFGQKDYQQLMVIRQMVEDLAMPVAIVGVPTVRDTDGLAMSSRNGYLTAQERAIAPALYRAIQQAADQLNSGVCLEDAARQARQAIDAAGLRTDYFSIRRQWDLGTPEPGDVGLVVLAAAWLGRARLIDNLEVNLDDALVC